MYFANHLPDGSPWAAAEQRKRSMTGISANNINLSIIVSVFIACVYGMMQVLLGYSDKKTKRAGATIYTLLILYDASYFVEFLLIGRTGVLNRVVHIAADFGEFLFAVLLLYMSVELLKLQLGSDRKMRKTMLLLRACVVMQIVMLIANIPLGFIYTIDENNIYRRGPAYAVSYVIPFVIVLTCFLIRLRSWRGIEKNQSTAFDIAFLAVIILLPLQLLSQYIFLNLAAATLVVTALYILIVEDQRKKIEAEHDERLLTQQRLVSGQLEPHFINNTLVMIRALCEPGSDAYRAISNLSEFVGGSLRALKATEPIPIEDELQIVERYLDIQNQRFENSIEVLWDIQDEDFCIPAFSIQLAAENAIKHGIRMRPDGRGTLSISTYETETSHVARIENDGVGFDPASVKEGTGLSSLKLRVEQLCGGSVDIQSAPDSNTVVTIYIPKKRKDKVS